MAREVYEVGEVPPLGEVPPKMHAWLVRPDRFGEPTQAWKQEVIEVPSIKDDEVLVYVMSAGVNYNNVWAGMGVPINVIGARNKAGEPEEFHIGGSDASGIVYKVGKDVTNVKVGDEVVVHCGTWDHDCDSQVGEIMHTDLITCLPQTSVIEVAQLLVEYHIHAVVVTNKEGHAGGVVSQTDVVLARQGRTPEELASLTADDMMTPRLVSCSRETTLSEAVTTMTRQGIHRLVVMEEQGERRVPVGVVSMTDIITKMIGAEPTSCKGADAN